MRLLERASDDFCARVGVLQVRHPGDSPVRGGVRSGGHLIFFCLCVLNEDFLMVRLCIRFSEEANPSFVFAKIRAESSSSSITRTTTTTQQQGNEYE